MKKILFLLLITVASYGQTYQNPTFGTVTTKTSPTVTNDPYVATTGSTGIQGKIAPVNLIIPHTPVNYTVPNLTIGAHLQGIDTRLGQISSTTAGLTQRIYFTADNTTVNSVIYFASSATGKGATAAGSPPNLVLADNTKGYFTKDLISIPQPAPTIGYAGSYSGNLTVSSTPTPIATQQRFTVEVYRTDNLGNPIASGVSGAPVGDLGVTVVAILDSGIINLTAGSITNVAVTGILTQNITINTGERLRYHVSAAKIGAGGGNVTFAVYYGSSYNSYYDVPVAITTDAVLNKSTVTGVTDTDALNNLNAKIPANYSKIVYVNNVNPNAATIFDLNNPPTVNDNSLKADVSNLYVGTNSSGWVYNSTSMTYVTNTITSTLSNFYLAGTTTDAGGTKTGAIYRTGAVAIGVPSSYSNFGKLEVRETTASTISLVNNVNGFNSDIVINSNAGKFSQILLAKSVGSVPTLRWGLRADDALETGSNVGADYRIARYDDAGNFLSDVITIKRSTGNVGFGIPAAIGKIDINTGSTASFNPATQTGGSVSIGNASSTLQTPTIGGKSTTANGQGLNLVGASSESNTVGDFILDVRRNDNQDYVSGLTNSAFRFTRFGNTLIDILRNGNTSFVGNVTTIAATAANHAVIKSQLDAVRPYKVYTALVSQSGTSNPVLSVLENTTGATVTASRSSTGIYTLTFSANVLTANKTTMAPLQTSSSDTKGGITWTALNTIQFYTYNAAGLVATDDRLNNSSSTIEIKIYP